MLNIFTQFFILGFTLNTIIERKPADSPEHHKALHINPPDPSSSSLHSTTRPPRFLATTPNPVLNKILVSSLPRINPSPTPFPQFATFGPSRIPGYPSIIELFRTGPGHPLEEQPPADNALSPQTTDFPGHADRSLNAETLDKVVQSFNGLPQPELKQSLGIVITQPPTHLQAHPAVPGKALVSSLQPRVTSHGDRKLSSPETVQSLSLEPVQQLTTEAQAPLKAAQKFRYDPELFKPSRPIHFEDNKSIINIQVGTQQPTNAFASSKNTDPEHDQIYNNPAVQDIQTQTDKEASTPLLLGSTIQNDGRTSYFHPETQRPFEKPFGHATPFSFNHQQGYPTYEPQPKHPSREHEISHPSYEPHGTSYESDYKYDHLANPQPAGPDNVVVPNYKYDPTLPVHPDGPEDHDYAHHPEPPLYLEPRALDPHCQTVVETIVEPPQCETVQVNTEHKLDSTINKNE